MSHSIRCPSCSATDNRAIDSRPVSNGEIVRRRRLCLKCKHRWTTIEISAQEYERRSGLHTNFPAMLKACQTLLVSMQKELGDGTLKKDQPE